MGGNMSGNSKSWDWIPGLNTKEVAVFNENMGDIQRSINIMISNAFNTGAREKERCQKLDLKEPRPTDWNLILATKVQIALYDALSFLDCIGIDGYEGQIQQQGDMVQIRKKWPHYQNPFHLIADKIMSLDFEFFFKDVPLDKKEHLNLASKEFGQKIARNLLEVHPLPWKGFAAQVVQDISVSDFRKRNLPKSHTLIYGVVT